MSNDSWRKHEIKTIINVISLMLVTCCVGGCFKLFNLVNMVLVSLIFLSNDNDLVIILSTLLLLMSMLSIVGTFSLPMSAYRSQTDVVRTDSITNIAWQFSNWMLWHNITLSTYKLRILMFLALVVFCSTPMPLNCVFDSISVPAVMFIIMYLCREALLNFQLSAPRFSRCILSVS